MELEHRGMKYSIFHTATPTEIYSLSLHDALPISGPAASPRRSRTRAGAAWPCRRRGAHRIRRSEEHTSELQSHSELVCRLLLEKKKHHDDGAAAESHARRRRARLRPTADGRRGRP